MGLAPNFVNPMQQMMLGVPQPAVPPPAVPVLDPRLLLNGGPINMGPQPMPRAPTPMPPLPPMDFDGIAAAIAKASQPPPEMPALPERQTRAPLQFIDPKMIKAGTEKFAPKDFRDSETQFKNDKFAQALAAAAMASTQFDDVGSVLAAAGGAFLGASQDADRTRKMETREWEAEQRDWQMQMHNLDIQIAQLKADQANTQSEQDFLDYQDSINYAMLQRDQIWQQWSATTEANRWALGAKTDLANMRFNYGKEQGDRGWANAEAQREYEDKLAMDRAGSYEFAPDGLSYSRTYVDAQGNRQVEANVPVGVLGKYQQMSQLAALVGGAQGEQMLENASNQILKGMSPDLYRQKVIAAVLNHPKGEEIWAPRKWTKQADGTFAPQTLPLGAETSGPSLSLPFIGQVTPESNTYKIVADKVSKEVENMLAKGQITADQIEPITQELIARAMTPYVGEDAFAIARTWKDPKINAMLDLLK